jgi:hypothetical protein
VRTHAQTVTTLEFDGAIDAPEGIDWDGAFITAEAFKLYFEGGMSALAALYDRLAALVAARRVRWVHLCSSGVDVPVFFPLMRACHETGAALTHCPGVYAEPIAAYVFAHILSITRALPAHAANQAACKYESLVQRDVRGCTVGVVGAGGIGAAVARLAKAFGMAVLGWRRRAEPAEHYDEVVSGPEGLAHLLAASDFVVVAVPKTAATTGLLGAEQFRQMKPTAWLLNIARGTVRADVRGLRARAPVCDDAPDARRYSMSRRWSRRCGQRGRRPLALCSTCLRVSRSPPTRRSGRCPTLSSHLTTLGGRTLLSRYGLPHCSACSAPLLATSTSAWLRVRRTTTATF